MNSSRASFWSTLHGVAGRWLALLVAVAITTTGGVLYGHYSMRWGASDMLSTAGEELKRFPRQIGSWTTVDDLEISKSTIEMLQCDNYVYRRYLDEQSGQVVQLFVVVGPPGPVAVHTPEICLASRNYQIEGDRRETPVGQPDGVRHTFWQLDFGTQELVAEHLRVYYAWSTGQMWHASDKPRLEYATAPFLYKIQVASPVSLYEGTPDVDAAQRFLNDLLQHNWAPVGETE